MWTDVKICLACNREFKDPTVSCCPHDGTSLIALKNEDEFLGKTLSNRYYVTEKIGQGRSGVVYKATHMVLDRVVAIKMLQPDLVADEPSIKQFDNDAKACSCLSHPHIVTLFDYGILRTGQPFLVMEYLEGTSLVDTIRSGPLAAPRAIRIFSQITNALDHAHTQGVVHGSLAPSNIILVERDGYEDFVKVTDFALGRLPWQSQDQRQGLFNTFPDPTYMSPELITDNVAGPSSDMYALGAMFFEALTGKPPFHGNNFLQTAHLHLTQTPPSFSEINPSSAIPESLEQIVRIMLAKQRDDRFQTMAELQHALEDLSDCPPIAHS